MNRERNNKLILLFALSVSLITTALTALFLTRYYDHAQFQILGDICDRIIREYPDCKQNIMQILKMQKSDPTAQAGENILYSFGYRQSDFFKADRKIYLIAGTGFILGDVSFLFAIWYWHRKSVARIRMLTDYLEKINAGKQGLLLSTSEDDFSRLQDEIYKTVTTLYQTRDSALEAKNNFADNLSNIAHQLKTPITAISLSTQMMNEHPSSDHPEQIKRQLNRLTHLEESLLVLSRIDAGTLTMKRTAIDVFTVLTLASDNLQELFEQSRVTVDIPEMGEIDIAADLDWTMEAIINLLKNCMEHTPAGTAVHCSYEKNPLYVQIRIWDEGEGFAKEDLLHLFDRFYRGKNANTGGIGIGLALAKAIIEMQDGIISAFNLPAGSACFEIRFYCH